MEESEIPVVSHDIMLCLQIHVDVYAAIIMHKHMLDWGKVLSKH